MKQFSSYKLLGEKTMSQLSDENLLVELNTEVNSVAIIIQHLSGNMISRFTDFLNTDGEKPWRNRDEEFVNPQLSREELMQIWNKGWDLLLNTLNSLNEEDLQKEVFIRGEAHTVQQAILRQLSHYSYHIGQIVLIGKILLGNKWTSLSIPKGASQSFNDEKFATQL